MRALRLAAVAVAMFAVAMGPLYAKKEKTAKAPEKKEAQTRKEAEKTEVQAAAVAGSEVVAYIGDTAITRQELEKAAASRLRQVRQMEYEALKQSLEGLAQQKLLEKEAAAKNLSLEELLRAEIEGKTPQPTKEEVDAFYEKNKARFQNKTREEVDPQIEQSLRAQRLNDRRMTFLNDLRQRVQLRVLLEPPRTSIPLPPGEPARGPEAAPVTLVEFADFQCPFCRRAHPIVEQVLAEYGDKIRYVFRDFPLSMHPRAFPASEAARCAGDQGKYWEYYKNLMEVAGDLSDNDLKKRATDLGLDVAALAACLGSDRHDAAIKAGFDDGSAAGVTGTPSFFINGRMIVGAKPVAEFKSIIEEELARGASGGSPVAGTNK